MNKCKVPRMVLVQWTDSSQVLTKWIHKDQVHDPDCIDTDIISIETVGWLYYEDDSQYKVACSIGDANGSNEQYSGIIAIPKGCVQTVATLIEAGSVSEGS